MEQLVNQSTETLERCRGRKTTRVYKLNPEWRRKWIGLVERNAEVQAMTEAVELLAKQFFLNDRRSPMLILAGVSGVGKTHCARALTRYARAVAVDAWYQGHWARSVPVVTFVKWAEFIESESDGVERDAREADLLILDDVGAESDRYKSGASVDKLCQILSDREGRFTLIASNLTVAQWAGKDARVADRMLRGSKVVKIEQTQSWALEQMSKNAKGG